METIKLKPCPFCGSEADIRINTEKAERLWVIITCKKCGGNVQKAVDNLRRPTISLQELLNTVAHTASAWNTNYNEDDYIQRRFDDFVDRIERQINETECKRDVFNLCKNAEEKARVNGFVDGLNWLLEIIDDEYTRHDEEDD